MQSNSVIRLAILGSDPTTAQLIEAAERSPQFAITARFDEDVSVAPSSPGFPTPPLAAEQRWEILLTDQIADIVVVSVQPASGPARDRRAEQLKRLVQAGVAIVMVHPACDMLLAYELEMNRIDGGGPIFPYAGTLDHPAIRQLCAAVSSGEDIGTEVEQYVLERCTVSATRSRQDVLEHFARDALVAGRLLPDIGSVSATGVRDEDEAWGQLNVHFAGDSGPAARWTMAPPRSNAGLKLQIVGPERTLTAWMPDAASEPVTVDVPLSSADAVQPQLSVTDAFWQQVASTLADQQPWTGLSWNDVCRSLEVTDAVQRSVKRMRTIELYHEQVTEQDTFKSVMAAGGCGLLLWVLTVLLIAGLVEGLRLPIRDFADWR